MTLEQQSTVENGILLQAQGINKNRILKVMITIPPKENEEAEEAPQDA